MGTFKVVLVAVISHSIAKIVHMMFSTSLDAIFTQKKNVSFLVLCSCITVSAFVKSQLFEFLSVVLTL